VTISNSFGSLDTRSMVAVLTRNVKIVGDTSAPLGGSVVVTSALLQPMDSPVLNNVVQTGYANLNNVQLLNLGDSGSKVSALNFVGLSSYSLNSQASSVVHCAVHNCSFSCLNVTTSSNITITNSVFALSQVYVVYVEIV